MMKTVMQGTAPRWWTAIMMTACAFFLYRIMEQIDATSKATERNSKELAVLTVEVGRNSAGLGTAIESISKIDQISRVLEQRLVRLETKEERR